MLIYDFNSLILFQKLHFYQILTNVKAFPLYFYGIFCPRVKIQNLVMLKTSNLVKTEVKQSCSIKNSCHCYLVKSSQNANKKISVDKDSIENNS